MNWGNVGRPTWKRIVYAASFAVVLVGVLSLGLGVTTYTVAKANDLVFAGLLDKGKQGAATGRCVIE